ncbi:MAG: PHP domain-containing protein [Spirochaetales bacterium]|nr:PHP domain-containing protein [Spirochaetales bacterium]
MIDLHTHSTESDGTNTPAELMDLAKERGITTIALTDHDTCAGLEEAENRARELGIRFIPGIELEISFKPGEFHLLGLNIINWKTEMVPALDLIMRRRLERNLKMVSLMQSLGIELSYEDVVEEAKGQVIGRPHFASLLVKKGIVKNSAKAFEKYLAVGRPFYIEKEALALDEGIDLIKRSGGHPVIAHPMSLFVSWGKLPERLAQWKETGIEGIEVWHSGAKPRKSRRLEIIADDLGFFKTGGSDYHGDNRKDRPLGLGTGGKAVPIDPAVPFL